MKKVGNDLICVTCGMTIVVDKHGQSPQQPLYISLVGGYSDMVDSLFHEEELIPFCHKCGHRILRLMGRRIVDYIEPLSTTSHVRPHDAYKGRDDVYGWWHMGWDNVVLRGYISAMWHYFRLMGFKGVPYAFKQLFETENYDALVSLNKSTKGSDFIILTLFKINLPKWYCIRLADRFKEKGNLWKN